MPVPSQQDSGIIPTRSAHSNAPWTGTRRSGEQSLPLPADLHDAQPPMERLTERLAEIERMLSATRRHTVAAPLPLPGPSPHAPMPGIPAPAPPVPFGASGVPGPTQIGIGSASGFPPPSIPPQTNCNSWMTGASIPSTGYSYAPPTAAPGAPPRPYTAPMLLPAPTYGDDIYKDFSRCSPQEYFFYETRLYQRINFQAKVRLGYGKAIAVLQRELENLDEYERIIRPYQIDQPDTLPPLSPLIPNSEARLFADTVRALVDIIGLQRSVQVLEDAKVHEVPGIRYEIQRVPIAIPPRAAPIPLEPESIPPQPPPPPPADNEIGPFARPRSNSVNSVASSAPTMYSWSPTPMNTPLNMSDCQSPSAAPVSMAEQLPLAEVTAEVIPPPPIPGPPTNPRGILRRSASGSSLNGKRVTIQTDRHCDCGSHYPPPPPTFEQCPVMSPITMSPIRSDATLQAMDLAGDYQHRMHNGMHECKPIKPEEGVLQQMAAAQM